MGSRVWSRVSGTFVVVAGVRKLCWPEKAPDPFRPGLVVPAEEVPPAWRASAGPGVALDSS
jgi:hypothetical protein